MKSEFDLIRYIKKSFGLKAIGDDCAVLPGDDANDLLLTADLLVEEVDFDLRWAEPEDLGHKALAISLSDVAAMGGVGVWSMLTLAVPQKLWETDFVTRFYDGWISLARRFEIDLVGGDISRSPDRFAVDCIVGGRIPAGTAVLRSGAQDGDAIYVSGRLGAAAGGLRLLKNKSLRNDEETDLIRRQLRPEPRVELGTHLRRSGLATSMIDISDGFSSDLHHICEDSAVGAEIDASAIPIDSGLSKFFDADESLALALNGGEDLELLFTVPSSRISELGSLDVTMVGVVTDHPGKVEIRDAGRRIELKPSGYRHF